MAPVKIQSSHYRNVASDPRRTGRGSLGMCRAHFGNPWSNSF